MRKWRPFDVPADDEWAVYYQIVVPKSYRHEILSIAHESPMSGHLGINKTCHKTIYHFYWPGLKSDVSKYCKTCHTCQMVGKPNQTIPKAQFNLFLLLMNLSVGYLSTVLVLYLEPSQEMNIS